MKYFKILSVYVYSLNDTVKLFDVMCDHLGTKLQSIYLK